MGFGHWRPPAKQQGPGSQGQPGPALPYGERRAGGEKGLRCFPEPRRLRDVVCCWKRVSLCRMQLPEARFGLSLRRGLGAERPCWLRGHGRGLGEEGLSTPNPACPRRRTCVECDSGAGNPQQSSRAQGARGSPAPLCPMESGGPGVKRACVDILRGVTARLWFAAQGECPFAECSSQNLPLGRRCEGASALSGRAGSGAWLGAGCRRPSRTQSYLPTKENPFGVGFRRRRAPAKHQGPGSQGQPGPALPYGERRAGGENSLRCFHEPRQEGDVVCCWKSFPLQNAAPRSSFWAVAATGPRL